jgi:hypothetical protein
VLLFVQSSRYNAAGITSAARARRQAASQQQEKAKFYE